MREKFSAGELSPEEIAKVMEGRAIDDRVAERVANAERGGEGYQERAEMIRDITGVLAEKLATLVANAKSTEDAVFNAQIFYRIFRDESAVKNILFHMGEGAQATLNFMAKTKEPEKRGIGAEEIKKRESLIWRTWKA